MKGSPIFGSCIKIRIYALAGLGLTSAFSAGSELLLDQQVYSLGGSGVTGDAHQATPVDYPMEITPNTLPLIDEQPGPLGTDDRNTPVSSLIDQGNMLSPGDAVFLLPQKYFKRMPETDLIALSLEGHQEWERMAFDDLDVALDEDGDRYLPLVRLLNAFRLPATTRGEVLSFRTGDGNDVELDLANSRFAMNGELHKAEYITGVSDITLKREIYLSRETISAIFGFTITWDDLLYRFVITTDESFPVWKRRYAQLMGQHAVNVPNESLPSLYDTAEPNNNLVSFVETRSSLSAYYESDQSAASSHADASVRLWGNLFGGQYRMRHTLPAAVYSDALGWVISDGNPLVPSQIQWRKEQASSQLTVGDVGLALNDLAIPSSSMTGIRFSGVGTFGEDAIDARKSQYGLYRRLVADKIYSGIAEIGSVVNLVVNDRVIQSITVVADNESPLGYGRYEFDEIAIGGGSRSDIQIDIIDPAGIKLTIDKPTVSSSRLLPQKSFSYLAGLGTRRNYREWDAEGLVGGGRLLYGVTPYLTLGLSTGYQDGLFFESNFLRNDIDFRGSPKTSTHIATEFAAQIVPGFQLAGDVAMSSGKARGDQPDEWFEGVGVRLLSDWSVTDRIKLRSQWFNYEPGFFNGSNGTDLQDRRGYGATVSLPSTRWFGVSGGIGHVEDNVDGNEQVTNQVDFQHINLHTRSIPYTALRVGLNHMEPEVGEAKTRVEVDGSWNFSYFSLSARRTFNSGNRTTGYFSNLLRGLNFTGVELNTVDNTSLAASVRLPENHRLFMSWNQSDNGFGSPVERFVVTHTWSGFGLFGSQDLLPGWFKDRRLSVSTSLNVDTQFDENEIRTYLGLPFRSGNGSGIRFSASYNDKRGAYIGFDVDFENLFATSTGHSRLGLTKVPSYFNPNYGGISGVVYLDINANGTRDPGEPGVSEIGVQSIVDGASTQSSRDGTFLLGKRPDVNESELLLNADTIPAHLKPTHAQQGVRMLNGAITQIEFGLAPLVAVSGYIKAEQPYRDGEMAPLSGTRVYLLDEHGNLAQESITAGDGSYYLDVIPGNYALNIDVDTTRKQYIFENISKEVRITGHEEYQELNLEPILAKALSEDEIRRMQMQEGSKHWDLNIPLIREPADLLSNDAKPNKSITEELIILDPAFDI